MYTVGRDPNRVVGYSRPDWADVSKPWSFHPVTPKGSYGGHAVGFGDVNGHGRTDILVGTGWIEQPAAGAENGLWEVHPAPFGRGNDPFVRGADMFLYDVNGDGLPDVITSLLRMARALRGGSSNAITALSPGNARDHG